VTIGVVPTDQTEIARADPVLRRRALLVLLAVVALGAAAIHHAPAALHGTRRALLLPTARRADAAGHARHPRPARPPRRDGGVALGPTLVGASATLAWLGHRAAAASRAERVRRLHAADGQRTSAPASRTIPSKGASG
jgi:hypothetical protein